MVISDGEFDFEGCFFDDEEDDNDDPTCFELIQTIIEQLEGFKVDFEQWEILKVFHWGTEIGACYHYGSYIAITPNLINELSKYDCDLEAFMVENDINYKILQPAEIKHPKTRPDLHYSINWTGDHTGQISDGELTCWFTYNHRQKGNHIELIYKNQATCSCWPDYLIDDELIPWFDAIWADIKTNNRQPRRFNLAQRIGSYLPLGFKAFSDGFNKAEVQRTRKKYAYMTQRGDRYIISKSPIPKDSDISTKSLVEAVSLLLKMINNQQKQC